METPTELGCWVDELSIYPLVIYNERLESPQQMVLLR